MGTATATRVMKVHVHVRAAVDATVDLVAWYAGFSPQARANYWFADLTDFIEEPFQRPISFVDLTVYDAAEDIFVPISRPEGTTRVEVDIRDYAALTERAGKHVSGDEARWTLEDYLDLLAAVPWLRPDPDDGLPPITMNVPFDGMEDTP